MCGLGLVEGAAPGAGGCATRGRAETLAARRPTARPAWPLVASAATLAQSGNAPAARGPAAEPRAPVGRLLPWRMPVRMLARKT